MQGLPEYPSVDSQLHKAMFRRGSVQGKVLLEADSSLPATTTSLDVNQPRCGHRRFGFAFVEEVLRPPPCLSACRYQGPEREQVFETEAPSDQNGYEPFGCKLGQAQNDLLSAGLGLPLEDLGSTSQSQL